MPVCPPVRSLACFWFLVSLALACSSGKKETEPPAPAPPPPVLKVTLLGTTSLAGQTVPVIPLTMVVTTESLATQPAFSNRKQTLLWADSVLQNVLENRAPEVTWIFPPELRKMAKRSPGVLTDPDRMGQAVMREPQLKTVPDPFRSSLRALEAMAGGRWAFIPAAVYYSVDSTGALRAELQLVMADARTGKVLWRSTATGFSPDPARALSDAMISVIPATPSQP